MTPSIALQSQRSGEFHSPCAFVAGLPGSLGCQFRADVIVRSIREHGYLTLGRTLSNTALEKEGKDDHEYPKQGSLPFVFLRGLEHNTSGALS